MTNPKTQSPGAGFFKSIKGFDDIQGGKADTLSGVTVVDPYTVKIELAKPDATFMQVVALNFSGVVPKEEVEKWGADFGHHPIGSGPYKVTEWTLGQRIVFERNKDFYVPGVPYLDKIIFEIGQEPLVALLRLQKGEIDLAGDSMPPAKFLEVMKDPAWCEADAACPAAADRLRHDERRDEAVRRRARPQGGQHGDQQGAHHQDHQRPRDPRRPAAASRHARLRQGLQGLSPSTSTRPRR